MLPAQYYASSMCLWSSFEQSSDDPRAVLETFCWVFTKLNLWSDCVIWVAYHPRSHVVHVAAPRVHDPLKFCHVIGVKIWVNICPPSFLIVRPMGKLLRVVPSAVLSIPTFSALRNETCLNINCRRTYLTCQAITFRNYTHPRVTVCFSDSI